MTKQEFLQLIPAIVRIELDDQKCIPVDCLGVRKAAKKNLAAIRAEVPSFDFNEAIKGTPEPFAVRCFS